MSYTMLRAHDKAEILKRRLAEFEVAHYARTCDLDLLDDGDPREGELKEQITAHERDIELTRKALEALERESDGLAD